MITNWIAFSEGKLTSEIVIDLDAPQFLTTLPGVRWIVEGSRMISPINSGRNVVVTSNPVLTGRLQLFVSKLYEVFGDSDFFDPVEVTSLMAIFEGIPLDRGLIFLCTRYAEREAEFMREILGTCQMCGNHKNEAWAKLRSLYLGTICHPSAP